MSFSFGDAIPGGLQPMQAPALNSGFGFGFPRAAAPAPAAARKGVELQCTSGHVLASYYPNGGPPNYVVFRCSKCRAEYRFADAHLFYHCDQCRDYDLCRLCAAKETDRLTLVATPSTDGTATAVAPPPFSFSSDAAPPTALAATFGSEDEFSFGGATLQVLVCLTCGRAHFGGEANCGDCGMPTGVKPLESAPTASAPFSFGASFGSGFAFAPKREPEPEIRFGGEVAVDRPVVYESDQQYSAPKDGVIDVQAVFGTPAPASAPGGAVTATATDSGLFGFTTNLRAAAVPVDESGVAQYGEVGFGLALNGCTICTAKALPDEADVTSIPPGSVTRYTDYERGIHAELKWLGGLLPELSQAIMDFVQYPRHWRVLDLVSVVHTFHSGRDWRDHSESVRSTSYIGRVIRTMSSGENGFAAQNFVHVEYCTCADYSDPEVVNRRAALKAKSKRAMASSGAAAEPEPEHAAAAAAKSKSKKSAPGFGAGVTFGVEPGATTTLDIAPFKATASASTSSAGGGGFLFDWQRPDSAYEQMRQRDSHARDPIIVASDPRIQPRYE